MRHSTTSVAIATSIAFVTAVAASAIATHFVSDAHAQAAAVAPMMIDLTALKHADLPATSNPEMNTRMLVTTDNATLQVQSGNVAKRTHPKTDEIQYIIEGSGSMWLGNERKEFKPGTLIIVPKGTPHGGSVVASGPVKALTVKIPPQPKDDTVFVN